MNSYSVPAASLSLPQVQNCPYLQKQKAPKIIWGLFEQKN
jgi:hypothetical protein